jgi:hypothetical protein
MEVPFDLLGLLVHDHGVRHAGERRKSNVRSVYGAV